MEELIKDIRIFLEKNTNEVLIKKYAYYFKEGFESFGVAQEILFPQKDIWYSETVSKLSIEEVISLGKKLCLTGIYEEGSLAILFLIKYKKLFKTEHFELIGEWLDSGIRNWAHTDYLCSEIVSVFYEKQLIDYHDIQHWRFAESKWKRRSVPVGMLKLLKKNPDYTDILSFIDPMMNDTERVVHQGVGWFLRECWKREPLAIEEFLFKWKDTAARLIFQYACEKMTKENKERFRKEKKLKK